MLAGIKAGGLAVVTVALIGSLLAFGLFPGPDGVVRGYTWRISYYRLHGLQWAQITTITGKKSAGQQAKLNVGSDCSNPDPTQRGPEIGTP